LHLDESDPFNISVSWICFVERFITSLLSCIRVPLSPSWICMWILHDWLMKKQKFSVDLADLL
jgi:hypothetical protein